MDGWRRQMVQHGTEVLDDAVRLDAGPRAEIDSLAGLSVLEDQLLHEAWHELGRLQVLIDLSVLGVSGYQAADRLRATCRIDMGLK